jgi:hydrogenase expression/formation protein HypC
MQVRSVEGFRARCEARGIERDVSLFMLPEGSVAIGDFVVVHVGYAIQTISEQESRSAWEIYDAMLAAEDALEAPPAVTAVGVGES